MAGIEQLGWQTQTETAPNGTVTARVVRAPEPVPQASEPQAEGQQQGGNTSPLTDMNVDDAKARIGETGAVETLRQWRSVEVAGKNRKGVMEALDTRLAELETQS